MMSYATAQGGQQGYTAAQQQAWAQQQAQLQAQQAAAQKGGGAQQQPQQQQWNTAQTPQQQQQWTQQHAQQQRQAAGGSADVGAATQLLVSGCSHPTVGAIVRGNFTVAGENHGRKAYKRDSPINGLDVMIYFWDERDGPSFCGWWFGPKIGGDQVWAYQAEKSQAPPTGGWKVPYDGVIDASLIVSAVGGGGGQVPQQQGQQQWQQQQPPPPQQQQWTPQQQQQWQQRQQQPPPPPQQPQQQQQGQQWTPQEQQQWQQKQQIMEEMRKKQAEQVRQLNQTRQQEQQEKMLELKRQQEEMAKKTADERKQREAEAGQRREEQRASVAIRRVAQKLHSIQPTDDLEALKQELARAIETELGNCPQKVKDKIQEEADQSVAAADKRLLELEEAEKKRQEQIVRATALLKELSDMVNAAEASANDFLEKGQTLAEFDGKIDMAETEVNRAAQEAESRSADARAKTKACGDFVNTNSSDIRGPPGWNPDADGSEGREELAADADTQLKPTLKALMAKNNELQRKIEIMSRRLVEGKKKALKKAQAKTKMDSAKMLFTKYDTDKDGLLDPKEILAFAKGEYSFTIPTADVDVIGKALIEEGKKGVPFEEFQTLKATIGISRERIRDAQRRDHRIAKENEIADTKEKLQGRLEEAGKAITVIDNSMTDLEAAAAALPQKAKDTSSKDMLPAADAMDEEVKKVKDSIAETRKTVEALSIDSLDAVKAFAKLETDKLTRRMEQFGGRVSKAAASAAKFRDDAARKDLQELDELRANVLKVVHNHRRAKQLKIDDLMASFDANKDDKIDQNEFLAFFKTCEKPTKKEGEVEEQALSDEELVRLFTYLDEGGEGALGKENFQCFVRVYMKVVKESLLTNSQDIQEAAVRRLEVGEICEVSEGPITDEKAEIRRIRVKAMKDGQEGWVTPVGNQGTVFLEEGSIYMKVIQTTILTPTFDIAGTEAKEQARKIKDTTRKLKDGELLEIREWMKKDTTSGLMRMKVRAKRDGSVGWATAVGSNGAIFLEVA